jgi:hypothetical protein
VSRTWVDEMEGERKGSIEIKGKVGERGKGIK